MNPTVALRSYPHPLSVQPCTPTPLQFFTLDESEPIGLETLQPRTTAENNASPLLTTSEAGEFI